MYLQKFFFPDRGLTSGGGDENVGTLVTETVKIIQTYDKSHLNHSCLPLVFYILTLTLDLVPILTFNRTSKPIRPPTTVFKTDSQHRHTVSKVSRRRIRPLRLSM